MDPRRYLKEGRQVSGVFIFNYCWIGKPGMPTTLNSTANQEFIDIFDAPRILPSTSTPQYISLLPMIKPINFMYVRIQNKDIGNGKWHTLARNY